MIKVVVPATSANIGPGFDTLGIALNLYNTYIFEEIPAGLEIIGVEDSFNNEDNLVYTSMVKTFQKIGYLPKGIRITIDAQIPISRGLGSSAACILGGVIGANQIAGGVLSNSEILELATEIEGHPDNIAPALLGGLVVSIMENKKIYYNHINVAEGIKYVALVPCFTLSTKEARGVLPSNVQYQDAVYNVSRVSLLISALTNGNFELMNLALKDKLHQPYRSVLIPNYENITRRCDEIGSLGVFLSGAGPTIMTIIEEGNDEFKIRIKDYLDSLKNNWEVVELKLDLLGATII